MRFSREEVDVFGLEATNLLFGFRVLIYVPSHFGLQKISPNQEGPSVSSSVEIGQEAVDDMWLWREEVYRIHRRVHVPPFLDALDVCAASC